METLEGVSYYLKKLLMTPHLDSHSTADPKPEILSEIEFQVIEKMYTALCMCTCAEKTIILGKDD